MDQHVAVAVAAVEGAFLKVTRIKCHVGETLSHIKEVAVLTVIIISYSL